MASDVDPIVYGDLQVSIALSTPSERKKTTSSSAAS
jgi:hypothetical protein